jgi:hypothetical protein
VCFLSAFTGGVPLLMCGWFAQVLCVCVCGRVRGCSLHAHLYRTAATRAAVICLVSAEVAQQWLRMCTYRFRCTAFWVFKCRLAWQDAVACWFSSCWVLPCVVFVYVG